MEAQHGLLAIGVGFVLLLWGIYFIKRSI